MLKPIRQNGITTCNAIWIAVILFYSNIIYQTSNLFSLQSNLVFAKDILFYNKFFSRFIWGVRPNFYALIEEVSGITLYCMI